MKELHGELDDIKRKLSSLRKRGIDTKNTEYKIMNIPSKIKMAGITNNERDVNYIKDIYERVIADIDFLEKHYMAEQKKMKYMEELLEKANTFMKERKFRSCLPLYYEIRSFYKELSIESKHKLVDRCIHFYMDFQELLK